MRSEEWLKERFQQIWQTFFPEVEQRNIAIRWKGRWKNKFGHITSKPNKGSEIVINSFFRDERVPEDVIKLTIAHEIVHYMHGFHSHLPKKYNHPHKGNVVNKELTARGFAYAIKQERQWVKEIWPQLLKELRPTRLKPQVQRIPLPFSRPQSTLFPWTFFRRS